MMMISDLLFDDLVGDWINDKGFIDYFYFTVQIIKFIKRIVLRLMINQHHSSPRYYQINLLVPAYASYSLHELVTISSC